MPILPKWMQSMGNREFGKRTMKWTKVGKNKNKEFNKITISIRYLWFHELNVRLNLLNFYLKNLKNILNFSKTASIYIKPKNDLIFKFRCNLIGLGFKAYNVLSL
jgi:hypothetical protein